MSFRQLRVCYFVAPSLTRGRFRNLLLMLALASSVPLGSESLGNQDHILLPQIFNSSNLEGHVPVFISSRNRVAQVYPRVLGSLSVASYDSQGYGGGILSRLRTGLCYKCNVILVTIFDCMIMKMCLKFSCVSFRCFPSCLCNI
jgi:hypothetical protein